MEDVVIVGAGQAGAAVALRLRANGFEGRIDLIGREPSLPYQRPPLSKAYLKGEMTADRLLLRPGALYDDLRIAVRTEVQALSIDTARNRLALDDNSNLPYGKLVLATGARPRKLAAEVGGELANVRTLRDLADADGLRDFVRPGQRLLVIGGGYIGLEMAAVAAQAGMEVTLIEMQDRILQRVAAAETSDYFRALHLSHGIDLREGVSLVRLLGDGTTASLAALSDGSAVGVDLVVVGIGVQANDQLARNAGLSVNQGIQVDTACRTFSPDIYAAGDCAVFPFRGDTTRLESVQNACDQGEYIADHICGKTNGPYQPQPWFWSDQYDVGLKIAGLNRGYDRVIVRAGEKPGAQSVWYLQDDTLLAVDAINDPKSYMMGKRWLAADQTPDLVALADPSQALKTLATRTHL